MAPLEAGMTNRIPTQEKQAVALASVIAAFLLVAMKLTVGLLTGSLGVLSEAMHSGLDLVAAVLTYFSVRVSDKPADPDHPFGHGKIESLSAFAETALLFVTCAWIIWEAIRRLFYHNVHVEPTLASFGVMFIAITIDTFRSRALFRVARKYNSQALEADALHFSTDVYSSSVVILGLILVYVANQNNLPWLRKADPVAALVVAGIVVYITLKLGKRTVEALVDASPEGSSRPHCGSCLTGSRSSAAGPRPDPPKWATSFCGLEAGAPQQHGARGRQGGGGFGGVCSPPTLS